MNRSEMSKGQSVRERIIAAVVEYIQVHGYAPTTREIGTLVGLKSSSSVYTHMQKLIDEGKLESDTEWRNPRALRVPGYRFVEEMEIQQYRAIGTVEELQKAVMEEDILKFYYCESEDSYLLGIRIDNFYYAHWDGKRFVFDMSRHLPWGKHVVDETTAWKEHTYPSEPKEMDFSSWLQGFIKKECGGTVEECRTAVEKMKPKKPKKKREYYYCPACDGAVTIEMEHGCEDDYRLGHCEYCGQAIDWSE